MLQLCEQFAAVMISKYFKLKKPNLMVFFRNIANAENTFDANASFRDVFDVVFGFVYHQLARESIVKTSAEWQTKSVLKWL